MKNTSALLLDLSGVLYVGQQVLPGALEAIQRLQGSGMPLRFITNTTRSTRQTIFQKLKVMGFDIPKEQIFTAPMALKDYLEQHRLRPYLLIHPGLQSEFSDFPQDHPNAVVIGDAAEYFTYQRLNEAFRHLDAGAEFLAMGDNRYFREADGLSLDIGPFVHALEYASGVQAKILGKPSQAFFSSAIAEFECPPAEVAMVGDDAIADVEGAMRAGLQGILVKTGKYRAGDEYNITLPGALLMKDICEVVDKLII